MSLPLTCCCADPERWTGRLRKALAPAQLDVVAAASGTDGARALFIDHIDGEVLGQLAALNHASPGRVLAIASREELLGEAAAFRLMHAGAAEIVAFTDDARFSGRIASRLRRWHTIDALVRSELVRRNAIGTSRAWIDCLRRVVEVATHADGPMLLTGESGTGKELIARLVHALDRRPGKGELVVLDCTTVVKELSGSEFFGHERGAFTGAQGARDGAFALADRGTLFLDEVGELPPALQAQLLRVVQEKTYKRVGGNSWHRTNFRLICATHRDLDADVGRGHFRTDFFHRITRSRCHLPPLRDRGDDPLVLFKHFFAELCPQHPEPELDPLVARFLLGRPYPGNVRELRHLASRISDRHVGTGVISLGDIAPEDLPQEGHHERWLDDALEAAIGKALALGIGLKEIARATSAVAVRQALKSSGGNLQRAANLLKVTDRALQLRKAQGAA